MTKIHQLSDIGQSVWLDHIRRSLITEGELRSLIDKGLRGVTSNPSIFEKAIAGSADYDQALKNLIDEGKSVEEIYETLVIEDIRAAADQLMPVYEETDSGDGYISLEVSPTLAHDTNKTTDEAKRLYSRLDRPNVMIKVPATAEGIPAIKELISAGINVNVTLLFSVDNYRQVAEAYISGLERLAEEGPSVDGGHPVDRIASVASFFISRVDTAVDQALEKIGNKDLQGKIAIANAKVAYADFQRIFSDEKWAGLARKGARPQRVLWASTGTKNPTYSDILYVDELIGPQTVNTLPPATLNHFLDHGNIDETLTSGVEEAKKEIQQLANSGIELQTITQKLQDDGVAKFTKSFQSLMNSMTEKRDAILADKKSYVAHLGEYENSVEEALQGLKNNRIIYRIWDHDHTVWKDDPTEISNRLGWLHSFEIISENITEIHDLVEQVRSDGYTQALLLGMGGSSLAPEVFRFTFGVKEDYLDLSVLDSTDPGAVLEQERQIDPEKTLFIVSTKSGGTVETISFMKYFYNKTIDAVGKENVGKHFIAITDPGSSLEKAAKNLNFRKTFLNDPNIGGRYSALSFFGLVPAGLIGMDLELLLEKAETMACNAEGCNCPVNGDNTSAWLGTTMGVLGNQGRDKVTLIPSPQLQYYGAWVEQLIAESTGKESKGILPVDRETVAEPENYANDRLFIYLRLESDETYDSQVEALKKAGHPVIQLNLKALYDLGGEFFRWEMATAIAGKYLGINPFDQPNVEAAKVLAKKMVSAYQEEGALPSLTPNFEENGIRVYADVEADDLSSALSKFLSLANPGEKEGKGRGYVSIQAYVKPDSQTDKALQKFRDRIQTTQRMAVTSGYGPRFLHSTGQLHKGDAGNGLFIQLTSDMPEDVPVPDQPEEDRSSISFGVLKDAQALGDRQALLDVNRNVIRFHLGKDVISSINRLTEAIA